MTTKISDIVKLRLQSQQLTHSSIQDAISMVEWFGAVQGQEYAQTKWGLGLRLKHLKDADIENELSRGTIVRTHILRPTWHFVAASDIRWLLKLSGPRVKIANVSMMRKSGLDLKLMGKCNDIIIKLLQGGNQLTRNEVNREFANNHIKVDNHRLSYIMMQAELEGIICSGARRGNQFTYALLDERVLSKNTLSAEEGLGVLTAKYFKSRGPATVYDFSNWSGLTISDCRKGVDMNKSALEKIICDNRDYYFTGKVALKEENTGEILLLPPYDEYIMGYKDRSAILEYKKRVNPGHPFNFNCMMLYKGQVAGTWKRIPGSRQILVEYDFFNRDDFPENVMDNIIRRFSRFYGIAVQCRALDLSDNRKIPFAPVSNLLLPQ